MNIQILVVFSKLSVCSQPYILLHDKHELHQRTLRSISGTMYLSSLELDMALDSYIWFAGMSKQNKTLFLVYTLYESIL